MKLGMPLRFLRLTLPSEYLQTLTNDALLRNVKKHHPLTQLLNKFLGSIKNPIQINFQSTLPKRITDFTRHQMQAIDVESLQTSFQNSLQRLGELTRYRVSVNIVDPLEIVEENKRKEAVKSDPLLKKKTMLLEPKPIRQEEWNVFEKLEVPIHKMPRFYGLGEFHTKKFTDETGLELTLLENGNFCVIPRTSEMAGEAKQIIEKLLTNQKDPELEYNGIYIARIAELRNSGVMVKLYPTMEPTLLHNAELGYGIIHNRKAQSLGLKAGQEIEVKYLGRDPATGNMRLSKRIAKSCQM